MDAVYSGTWDAKLTIEQKHKNRWIRAIFLDSKFEIISVIIASSISYVLQIFVALFAMIIYNKIVPNNAVDTLVTISVGICIIILSDFIFKLVKTRIQQNQNRNLDLKLSDNLYTKIMNWDLQSVPKLPGSSALLLRDIDTVVQLFGSASINVVVGIPFILIYSVVIYAIASTLAYVTLASALLSFLIVAIYFNLIDQASTSAKNAQIEKSAAFIETLNNIEGVKSLGSYGQFFRKWQRVQISNAEYSEQLNKYINDVTSITGLITSLAQVIILALGAYLIYGPYELRCLDRRGDDAWSSPTAPAGVDAISDAIFSSKDSSKTS